MKTLIAAAALLLASAGLAAAQADPHAGHGAMDHSRRQGGHVTSPADGAMTHGSPESFSVTFHHPMTLQSLTLKTAAGAAVTLPALPAGAAETVSVKLPALAPGSYVAEWTAAGGDGHKASGVVRFMVH